MESSTWSLPSVSKSRRSYSLWTPSRSGNDNSYRGLDISILGQHYTDEVSGCSLGK